VKSGDVRVCYMNGKVDILGEGRYAVNLSGYEVGKTITKTQESLKFTEHVVMLAGGVQLAIKGLLTYQVVDVEKLVRFLGATDLVHTLEDVVKAEITSVFANVHLEALGLGQPDKNSLTVSEPASILGDIRKVERAEGSTSDRAGICQTIINRVQPFAAAWGTHINNFQLESTRIFEDNYRKAYEDCSLKMAVVNANARVVTTQNAIDFSKAKAELDRAKLQVEAAQERTRIEAATAAQKMDILTDAERRRIVALAEAEKRRIEIMAEADSTRIRKEAEARNDAGKQTTSTFAQTVALQELKNKFAASLLANVRTLATNNDSFLSSVLAQRISVDGKDNV